MKWQGLMMLNRELKRVPLEFDHPLHKVWNGYLITDITEPPSGKGYQCWETTSEGSPISPVFKTSDELYEWLATNEQNGITLKFTKDDWKNALTDACPVVDMATKELKLANTKLE